MKTKSHFITSLIISIMLLGASVAAGKTIYVDTDAPGANNGSSWTDAFNHLQDALTAASTGDQILVAQGIYRPDKGQGITPGDRSSSFHPANGLTIKGGYAGCNAPDPDARDIRSYETILSGDLDGNDVEVADPTELLAEPTRAENSCNVVVASGCDRTTLLEGLTITGGNGNGQMLSGAGIYNGKPTVSLCKIVANSAVSSGGGIYFEHAAHSQGALLKDSTISHNAANRGGGVYGCAEVVNCTFTDNAAVDGCAGALDLVSDCETTVTDCTFSHNYAATVAGAVYVGFSGTQVTFTRCSFIANSSADKGGAIYADGCTCGSYPTFYQCRFIGNNAGSDGGAICDYGFTDMQLYSCLLVGNSAGRNGGALCDEYDGGSALINCTVSNNTAAGQGGGVCYDNYSYKGRRLANTIIWANSDKNGQTHPYSQIYLIEVSELQDVTNCCIQVIPPEVKGQGNTTSDPLFVDADGPDNVPGNEDDNLHLLGGSPCVDTGHNEYVPQQSSDLDGNPRIINGTVDRGAYEKQDGAPPAGIIYVDDSATGANNGSSWANAFKHLQDALAAASIGNEIRVAQGVYKPDQGAGITPKDRSATFRVKSNVTTKGGYAGLGEPAPDARNIELYHTILTGDLAGDDAAPDNPADLLKEPTRIDNSYHVVTATDCNRATVLDGFTITAGNANGPTEAQKWGGGLYDGNPTVKNCIFINNSAGFGGGGIYFSGPYYNDNAEGLITDCTITHNAAAIGGGIYGCCVLSNCVINANAATEYYGGGVHLGQSCDTTVTDCVFSNNSAVAYGGGVSLGVSGSTPIFTQCTFIANSANGSGGGVASDGCTCGTYPEFHRCAFIANSAGSNGGGLYNFGYALAKMYSCLVIGNTAGNNGGGICDGTGYDDGGSLIVNCTLTHNTASEQGGGIYYGTYSQRGRSVANSILWYNADSAGQSGNCSQICVADATTTGLSTDHCCIQGWTGGGTGNIAKNPLFVDADGADNVPGTEDDNLHLQPDSPCIDKGRSSAVPPDSNDLDGNPRILAGSVDMGAYEFVAAPQWTQYDVIDLGTLGGDYSEARAINNYRQIVGWAADQNGRQRATLFDYTGAGNNIDLGTLGGNGSRAYSINILGDVVGRAGVETGYYHAALFDTGDPCNNTNLAGPGNDTSQAWAINDRGQIVGTARLPSWDWKATLFDPSDPNNNIDLAGGLSDPHGSDASCALSINNNGQIVGYAHTGTTSIRDRAILFDPSGAGNSIILTPGDDGGQAYCINDAGQIVGWSARAGAALFDPSGQGNNIALGGGLPGPVSINNRGQIVGAVTSYDEANDVWFDLAVLFDSTGAGNSKNLNDLIDKSIGWILEAANGVNDNGWIVGYGTNPHGDTHAFLLIPKNQKPGLVAHWKLDESEAEVAKDSAGTNDGILHGPQWQPYNGSLEGALMFDGENDYVNCGSDSAFDITGQITVAAWANLSSVNMEWQTIIAKGDSAWRLSTARNYRRYHFAVTGGPPWNYINGDIEVEAHEWHHVCGTYDGANLRLYIDGVEDPAGPVPEPNGVTTDDYDVYIGENQERPGRYWDGLIDDVRVYNYALTPAQVFNLCKPGVLYVDADAHGANNGSSWADAFKCLQDALAAAGDGTEIRVAQGAYRPDRGAGITPGDRQATFHLKNGVAIKGGYAGFGTPHPDARDIEVYETILSGDIAGNDVDVNDPEKLGWEPTRSENSYRVVTGSQTDATAIIDGFSTTGGYANYDDFSQCNGAGMFNVHGSPTVLNCTFIANFAGNGDGGGLGGGMYNYHGSPKLTNCRFVYNAAIALDGGEGAGGAMGNWSSNPTLTNCKFIGNIAGHDGGAMWNYESNPVLVNCIFSGNLAREGGSGSFGGGMWNYNGSASLINCMFAGNTARSSQIGSGGGGIWAAQGNATLINCTFNGNVAGRGGAISGDYPYEGGDFLLSNCILWNDKPQEIYTPTTPPVVTYSDLQGGWPGQGNINADPCFAAPGHWDNDLWIDGDYHLKSLGWRWDAARAQWTFDRVTSRCIDAGNPGSPLADEPLTIPDDPNNDWGCNLRIDIGAYGGTAEASIPPYDWAILADLNNDGAVDWLDFVCTGCDWLKTAPHQPCDLNRNGDVNPADLDLFADDWLKTTIWRK
jgi:probable HAF family extracellular repeat protein/predicted outer membrane repeat protein